VDYSTFKAFQFVLFFAPVFAFGFWQLRSLRRMRRAEARAETSVSPRRRADR
jgi:hypothetical protein